MSCHRTYDSSRVVRRGNLHLRRSDTSRPSSTVVDAVPRQLLPLDCHASAPPLRHVTTDASARTLSQLLTVVAKPTAVGFARRISRAWPLHAITPPRCPACHAWDLSPLRAR